MIHGVGRPQDDSRNPLWTYAHVPHAYAGDATKAIVDQIERFAPGFRDRIIGTAVRSTTEMSLYNPNYVGGDVIGGASSLTQLLFRPRSPSIRTSPVFRARTSARRRRHLGRARTGCAARTPPDEPWLDCAAIPRLRAASSWPTLGVTTRDEGNPTDGQ